MDRIKGITINIVIFIFKIMAIDSNQTPAASPDTKDRFFYFVFRNQLVPSIVASLRKRTVAIVTRISIFSSSA